MMKSLIFNYVFKDALGRIHKEDGPAVEYINGTKCWYLNDKLHRLDGPAIERADGRNQYWVNGNCLGFITSDQMLAYYLKYEFLK